MPKSGVDNWKKKEIIDLNKSQFTKILNYLQR